MVAVVVWGNLVCAVILFVLAAIEFIRSWAPKEKVATATGAAASIAQAQNKNAEELEKHAGIDFKGQWEALAALAAALKDLDRSTRLFVLSLAFSGIAGATAGLDSIGTGLGVK